MPCSINGCPGTYEQTTIPHVVRRNDHLIVIDHVPAEVCQICGDTLLAPDTIRRLETLIRERSTPQTSAPVYEYA